MSTTRLDRRDAGVAARTLADAFADDPAMCWAGGFADGTRRLVPLWRSSIALRFRRPSPEMYTTEQHEAVALWDAPGDAAMSALESMRALPAVVRTFRSGTARFLQVATIMEAAHPTDPHYYLLAVGVRRDRQGRGLGSAVLRPVLERCDDEGVAAYLENSKPRNEAFYVRHGFEPLGPFDLPDGAPPITPMWRAPR